MGSLVVVAETQRSRTMKKTLIATSKIEDPNISANLEFHAELLVSCCGAKKTTQQELAKI
jgi:hypothetical protein